MINGESYKWIVAEAAKKARWPLGHRAFLWVRKTRSPGQENSTDIASIVSVGIRKIIAIKETILVIDK